MPGGNLKTKYTQSNNQIEIQFWQIPDSDHVKSLGKIFFLVKFKS
jgi:hypothetical protein